MSALAALAVAFAATVRAAASEEHGRRARRLLPAGRPRIFEKGNATMSNYTTAEQVAQLITVALPLVNDHDLDYDTAQRALARLSRESGPEVLQELAVVAAILVDKLARITHSDPAVLVQGAKAAVESRRQLGLP